MWKIWAQIVVPLTFDSYAFACVFLRRWGGLMRFFSCIWKVCLRWSPLDPSDIRTTTVRKRIKLDQFWRDWYTIVSLPFKYRFVSFSFVTHLTGACLLIKWWGPKVDFCFYVMFPIIARLLYVFIHINTVIVRTPKSEGEFISGKQKDCVVSSGLFFFSIC